MKSKVLKFRKGFAVVAENKMAEAATMVIPPREKQGGPDNNHKGADQWLFVVSGQGSATIKGEKMPLKESTLILIERGENHEIENTGRSDLVTLNFYVPPAYTKSGNERQPAKPK